MPNFPRRLFQAHSLVITLLILLFAWGLMSLLHLNFHFIDPFNYTIQEYRLEDIVYSRFIGPNKDSFPAAPAPQFFP